jgi:hypothetical protein
MELGESICTIGMMAGLKKYLTSGHGGGKGS